MSWDQTLLDASFRGVKFDILKTDDSAERTLAQHSYPYVDGADVEDMGRGPRHISVDAIFYGADYEQRLQKFIDMLDEPDAGEFIHPVFGSIKNAQVAKYSIHHDAEGIDQAQVSIEFLESIPGALFFDRSVPSQKAEAITQPGATATAAAAEAHGDTVDRVRAANPLAPLDKLRTSMTGPVLAAVAKVSAVTTSGLDVLSCPRAWSNDIKSMVGGMLDVTDFGKGIMSQWSSIQGAFSLFNIFSSPSSSAPAPITAASTPSEAQAIAATQATIQVNTAVGLANAASEVLASEAATPTLSPIEIESICNTTRATIEITIIQVRAVYSVERCRTITEPLKDLGLAVQEAARAIIAARPPLIWRTANAPGNFRLLAHSWYGDHARASELYRLNGARSPFVNGGDSIHAYAN